MIEKELALLAARMPNFAEILYQAAREGRISGYTPMTTIIWPAGEIYTHLARGDVMRGLDLARAIRRELGQSEWAMSPLELLLRAVRPGEKPATSEVLKTFVDLLQPYLLSPEKIESATQQSLWEC